METSHRAQIDTAVVSGARAGSRPARAALYDALSGRLFTLLRRILGADAVAEDVLQDTFIHVFTRLDDLRDDAAISAWVTRIAVNRAMSHLRAPWTVRRVEGSPEDFHAEPCMADAQSDMQRLEAALDALPATARAVVWLYDVEGYTHKEIAELMGRSVSFSKTRLARAHAKLRELLGETQALIDGESADEEHKICVGQLKTI